MPLLPARLIYRCVALGGDWTPGPVTAAAIDQAAAAVEAARSIGVSVFDHADLYRFGKAEQMFGEVLKRSPGLRERIEIQTKCGIRLEPDHAPYDLDDAAILGQFAGLWFDGLPGKNPLTGARCGSRFISSR